MNRLMVLSVLAATLLVPPHSAAVAQRPAAARAATAGMTLRGVVIDAATERPLAGARIALQPQAQRGRGTPLQEVQANDAGEYVTAPLPAGTYVLYVRALGYRPSSLVVQVRDNASYAVSVGLEAQTVSLRLVRVTETPGGTFGATAPASADGALQRAADQAARAQFATSDSRVVTAAHVREAVTYGEPDLLRSLHRLPGVAARDEYSAGFWTRGAPWDQTLVLFDGLPLFNGLHGAGLVSAFNPDLMGEVAFHSGHQPMRTAGGAAGLVELTSRQPGRRARGAMLELSMLSGRATVEQAIPRTGTSVLAGVRRSHLDVLPQGLRILGRSEPARVPFAFADAGLRVDQQLGAGRLEASALVTFDELRGDIPGLVEQTRAEWGNVLVRGSYVRPLRDGELRATVGHSGFAAAATPPRRASASNALALQLTGYELGECGCYRVNEYAHEGQPLENDISVSTASVTWTRSRYDAAWITLGAQASAYEAGYSTTGTWPHDANAAATAEARRQYRHGSVWAEQAGEAGRFMIRGGVRADVRPADGTLAMDVSPRLAVRARFASAWHLTGALARSYQHAQAIAPPGLGRNAIATASTFWVLPDSSAPSIRADLATLGIEWSPDSVTAIGATAYARRAAGVATQDPRPGLLIGRPLYVAGTNHAQGTEMWTRTAWGRWSTALAYSHGGSRLAVGATHFPAPWERKHVARATLSWRAGPFRATSQYTASSGAPLTRYYTGAPDCIEREGCRWAVPPITGPAAESRSPGVRSLDAGIDLTRTFARATYGFYLQGSNVLGARAPGTYLDSRGWCLPPRPGVRTCEPARAKWDGRIDKTMPGLPRVIVAGVRTSF